MDVDKKSIAWTILGSKLLLEQIKSKEAELSALRIELAKLENIGVGKRLTKNQIEHLTDMSNLMRLCIGVDDKQINIIIDYYKQKHMCKGNSEQASQRYAEGKCSSARRALDRYRKPYKDLAIKLSKNET